VKAREQTIQLSSLLGDIENTLRNETRRMSREGKPAPDWFPKAAELGKMLMDDEKQPTLQCSGMLLHCFASGAAGVAALEACVLDDNLPEEMRTAAAQTAVELNPQTRIFQSLAGKYADLKLRLRERFATIAPQAATAPGAEEFVILCLKDAELGRQRRSVLNILRLPATPPLIAAVKELSNDKDLAPAIENAIHRLEGCAGRQ